MKDDELNEKDKAPEQQLTALREIVTQQKPIAKPKDDEPSESEKALAKDLAKRLLALRVIVRQEKL